MLLMRARLAALVGVVTNKTQDARQTLPPLLVLSLTRRKTDAAALVGVVTNKTQDARLLTPDA
jgi:hypothetical protein